MNLLRAPLTTTTSKICLSCLVLVLAGTFGLPAHAQTDDAQNELTKGIDLLRRHRYEDALKSFKQANELRGRNCAECFWDMAQTYYALVAYKNVIDEMDFR